MGVDVRYGIYIPNYGPAVEPRSLMKLAKACEEAGWDGFYMWDHVYNGLGEEFPFFDPWISLALVAIKTNKIRIGTTVTPVARRRPRKLARETVTLDHLSGGRLTLGVGLGFPPSDEFENFGEDPSLRVRAEKLDEGLDILQGLWSGEPFSYEGRHYRVDEAQFFPRPIQSPRIPIWVAGTWPNRAPFIRAARFDGVFPLRKGFEGPLKPQDYVDILSFVEGHRGNLDNFDVAFSGYSTGEWSLRDVLPEYFEAGVNWWLECLDPWRGEPDELEKIVRMGPPRT